MVRRLDWERVRWENLIAVRGAEKVEVQQKCNAGLGADNYVQTRRLVVAFNHPFRRDAKYLDKFRREYYESLRQCNICADCKRPIRTRRYKSAPSVPFSEKRLNNPKFYGIIRSHFEYRVDNEKGRYYYIWIDGTGRHITYRREAKTRLKYLAVLKDDGTEERIREPAPTYTVYDTKCIC